MPVRALAVRSCRRLLGALVALFWVITLAGLAARLDHRAELAANLVPALFILFAASTLALVVLPRRGRLRLAAAGAGVLWHGAALLPLWIPPPTIHGPPAGRAAELRVAFANVLASTRPRQRLLDRVLEGPPDIAAFAEVGPHYGDALTGLRSRLPYSIERYRGDCFGLAVFSRWPLEDPQVILADGRVPLLAARLRLETGPLRLVIAHAPPPNLYPDRHRLYLQTLAAVCSGEDPILVLGDLNATPWSPRFRDLCASAGLVQARRGFGLAATWSPRRLHLPVALLPIDHVLLRGPWRVLDFAALPALGSDHRPIRARLEVAPAQEEPEGGG